MGPGLQKCTVRAGLRAQSGATINCTASAFIPRLSCGNCCCLQPHLCLDGGHKRDALRAGLARLAHDRLAARRAAEIGGLQIIQRRDHNIIGDLSGGAAGGSGGVGCHKCEGGARRRRDSCQLLVQAAAGSQRTKRSRRKRVLQHARWRRCTHPSAADAASSTASSATRGAARAARPERAIASCSGARAAAGPVRRTRLLPSWRCSAPFKPCIDVLQRK